MKKILLPVILLFTFIIAHSQSGTITNIQVSQRTDGSGLIDVYFDLAGEANSYNILLEISFNGGDTYTPVSGNYLEGDTGHFSPGEEHQITWNGHESFPSTYSTKAQLRIIAVATVSGGNGLTGQPCPGMPTFTDSRDGNVYNTVQIGAQCWLKENLKYLPEVSPSSAGSKTDPHYYVYGYEGTNVSEAKATDNYKHYGVLYNWPAAMNGASSSEANPSGVQGVCPAGWHLPSDSEWTQLKDYLMDEYELTNDEWDVNGIGNNLKSCRQVNSPLGGDCATSDHPRWNSHSTHYGTDEFGFSALPGGARMDINGDGILPDGISTNGIWWTSSEYSSQQAWTRGISDLRGWVYRGNYRKVYGFSARCVQDYDVITLPILSTTEPDEISYTTAVSGGNIISEGNTPVTARGVVWSTSEYPTISNNEGITIDDDPGITEYTSTLTGLQSQTIYYVRAYATNEAGTSYGEQKIFETVGEYPIVNFTVYDYSDWTPENFRQPQPNAVIKIYLSADDVGSANTYDVLTTDQNAQSFLYGSRLNNYYFTVEYANKSNIINGFLLLGTYNSQEDIDNYPYDPNAEIGGFKFQDTNGDGIINDDDKINYDFIRGGGLIRNVPLSKELYIADED